jgi:hypothetical protein
MLAYHGNEELRTTALATMAAHREADELVQGYGYWKDGKGCAVGCLLKSGEHADYETKFGIPQMLARLEDAIFEGLPKEKAQKWPERFLGSIKAGANLSLVGWKFQLWLQIENQKFAEQQKMPQEVLEAIKGVLPILKIMATKGKLTKKQESAARSAESAESAARSAVWSAESAESAARSAARSAASAARSAESAESAARSAVWSAESAASAAWSAEWSAESAAWRAESAARSAAWSAASAASAAWERMADKLIELLNEAA